MCATIPGSNSLAIFNTNTLQLEATRISDQRFLYRDGAIYLKNDMFLSHGRDGIQFQMTFADQSQLFMLIYVQLQDSPWHNKAISSDVDED